MTCISSDHHTVRADYLLNVANEPEERRREQAQNKEARSLYSGLLCKFPVV